jgi:SNF2 family DNA or RNA helicase
LQDKVVVIPYDTVAALSEEERVALALPDSFPFEIEVRAKGKLTDPNFRYDYSFLNGRNQPFVNPKKVGSYLEISPDQMYLLTGEQYSLIESIDAFNKQDNKSIGKSQVMKDNYLAFAKIQGLARETGATLDTYLNNEQVVAPSNIGIRLRKVDKDTIEVQPVLYGENKTDENNSKPEPVLNDYQSENFIKVFDRFSKIKDIYPVPKGPKIIFNDHQKKALNQLKQNPRFSGKDKETLLKNPQQIFDPELFYLDDFSERVLEIGEYRPKVFPFLRPAKEPWIPPEGGIIIDGTMVYVTANEAGKLKERIGQAIERGQKEITWKDQTIPATNETLQAIDDLIKVHPSEKITSQESNERIQKSGSKNVLIIRDNFDQIDYATTESVRPGSIGSLPCRLRSGIKLLKHQIEGLTWMQKLWVGGAKGILLADDMGLGKTLQALAFLAWVRELMDDGKIDDKPMLIVAPVVLLKNWIEEYRKFLNPIFGPFLELHSSELRKLKNKDIADNLGIKKEIEIKDESEAEDIIKSGRGMLLNYKEIRKKKVVLTTYETLRDYQFSLGLIDWGVMVLDESQKIKTPTAMVTTAVKAMKYDFGVSLTGTPVENSWVDLWSIMDFIQPGKLGSLKEFVAKYQNPLKKEDTDREALGLSLKEKIKDSMLRRMKEDYLQGLPEKNIKKYESIMPKEQLDSYIDVIQKAREKLPDRLSGNRKQHILNTIAAIRDISLHPYLQSFSENGLAGLSDEKIINSSARLKQTIEILDEIYSKREKAIIFVISRKMQRVVQRLIQNRYGISCIRPINGEVAGGRRKMLVDSFQNAKGFNVIIMSPEAAGVGLTVTAANHVIHLSRAWNPAKEDQATDRVYRIGQPLPVTVHIPLSVHPMFDNKECNGTFDLKLDRLLEMKRQLSRNVLLPPIIENSEWQTFGEESIKTPSFKKFCQRRECIQCQVFAQSNQPGRLSLGPLAKGGQHFLLDNQVIVTGDIFNTALKVCSPVCLISDKRKFKDYFSSAQGLPGFHYYFGYHF